jgi:hypothetical protein
MQLREAIEITAALHWMIAFPTCTLPSHFHRTALNKAVQAGAAKGVLF